jgi:hypothetical protein
LRDRRIGKPSSRRAAAEEIIRMVGLYEERYAGFTVKHFHEQLQKRHTAVQFRRSRSLMVLRVCRGNPPWTRAPGAGHINFPDQGENFPDRPI